MTKIYGLMVLLVMMLVATITILYDLTILLFTFISRHMNVQYCRFNDLPIISTHMGVHYS